MTTRMILRRGDGRVYLERWGWECTLFGVYLHKMTAPDPGLDMHDHPWPFISFILRGGYIEHRMTPVGANTTSGWEAFRLRVNRFGVGTINLLGLRDAHRITHLIKVPTWTLVIRGRRQRRWGFYTPEGWVPAVNSARERRDLSAEFPS